MKSVGRVTEITCVSEKGFDDAIQVGVERASKTLRNITSAWVKEMRVHVKDAKVTGYQVNLLITFVLDT